MTGDLVQTAPIGQVAGDIGAHFLDHFKGGFAPCPVKDYLICPQQNRVWRMVGRATDHHPVQPRVQKPACLIQRGNAAIDRNMQIGEIAFHLHHQIVIQRRHIAVFLGAEPLQPRLAGVDGETGDAGGADRFKKSRQDFAWFLLVHTNAAFHGDFNIRGGDHFGATLGHQRGFFHQHRAKTARLHPIRGAADVQVDLVIALVIANAGGRGQFHRIRPAQLHCDGVFRRIKPQQMPRLAAHQCGGCDHFGIKQRAVRHQPV